MSGVDVPLVTLMQAEPFPSLKHQSTLAQIAHYQMVKLQPQKHVQYVANSCQ